MSAGVVVPSRLISRPSNFAEPSLPFTSILNPRTGLNSARIIAGQTGWVVSTSVATMGPGSESITSSSSTPPSASDLQWKRSDPVPAGSLSWSFARKPPTLISSAAARWISFQALPTLASTVNSNGSRFVQRSAKKVSPAPLATGFFKSSSTVPSPLPLMRSERLPLRPRLLWIVAWSAAADQVPTLVFNEVTSPEAVSKDSAQTGPALRRRRRGRRFMAGEQVRRNSAVRWYRRPGRR